MPTEDQFYPSNDWCPNPHYWTSDDIMATEHQVTELVGSFVRALQPEFVLETGTYTGSTTLALGTALQRNGHGRGVSLEIDAALVQVAQQRVAGLPIEVLQQDILTYTPPVPVDFAWIDSGPGGRMEHLRHVLQFCREGTILGVHDTNVKRDLYAALLELVQTQPLRMVNLRSARGMALLEVLAPVER